MAQKVLITGGLGFIGLALARTLVWRGMKVRLMDNLNPQVHGVDPQPELGALLEKHDVEVMRGDVCQRRDWVQALRDITSVVHLAAETGTGQSMYRIGDYTSTNVLGTALLLDVLANDRHEVTKLVLASSRSVYGEGAYRCTRCGPVYPPMRSLDSLQAGQWEPPCPRCHGAIYPVATPETARTSPASVYAATKLAQEDLVRIAANALGIPFLIFRLAECLWRRPVAEQPLHRHTIDLFQSNPAGQRDCSCSRMARKAGISSMCRTSPRRWRLGLSSAGGDGLTLNVGSGAQMSVETIARSLKRQFHESDVPVSRIGSISLGRYPPQLCGHVGHRAAFSLFAQSAA